jgi:hypothetical protein
MAYELLALEAGTDTNEPWKDSWFPFTLAGNIQIPFDKIRVLLAAMEREFEHALQE